MTRTLTMLIFSTLDPLAAVRLITTASLPSVSPQATISFLATPANWPAIVLSSWSVKGNNVDRPVAVGETVDEIFGLPPLLPLKVSWTCTSIDDSAAVFDSPSGLAGVAKNCRMDFAANDDGASGTLLVLEMSYESVTPLADVAAPVLVIDNAIALKLILPCKFRPLGSSDPIAGPLVAFARRAGLLPAAEDDGWTGEPTAWAQADSLPQRLSELSQRFLGGFKQWAAEKVAGEFDAAAVDAAIEAEVSRGGVTVFAFAACPFCKEAKALLDAKGAKYTWLLLDEREDGAAIRARLGARTGRTSVPSVWIGEEYCGGLNDGCGDEAPGLSPLQRSGELDGRLRAAGAL
jgi:glutaredoxin